MPTLEKMHTIAVGKGLKLRLPIMIKLNDKDNICFYDIFRREMIE
jgi:hypothetical protein